MPVNSFDDYPLSWKPKKQNDGKPLYISLADQLEKAIKSGELQPNTMLPPQRELADYLDINLSTITRSFKLCELKGLIYATVGRGTYVSPNAVIPSSGDKKDNMIDLSHIEPFNETNHYIHEAIQEIMLRQTFDDLFEYNPNHTDTVHKYAAARLLGHFGIRTQPEQIIITAGSQNALSIILLSLFSAGDKIAVDQYTYHHFKTLANYLNIRLLPVPSDNEGMLPDKLSELCRLNHINGIYLMPGCNNPTSVLMPQERRSSLGEVIKKYGIIVIEDDSYVFLSDMKISSFYELVPDQTVYVLGTSKSLCAGLRCAFITAPEKFIVKLKSGYESINLRISPLDCEIISELIFSDTYQRIFHEKKRLSQERNNLYDLTFDESNPYHNPYSFFRWQKLPAGLNSSQAIKLADSRGISIMAANRFAIGPDSSDNFIRIAISTPGTAEILAQGLSALKDILNI